MSVDTLSILNRIDEIYTDNPEFGYRYIHQQLLEDGFIVPLWEKNPALAVRRFNINFKYLI